MELANNALTTLDRLKLMMGLDAADDSQNSLLVMLINQGSSWIEHQLGRKLGKAVYHESVKPSGNQSLLVDHYPVLEVHSIERNGELLDPGTYDYTDTGAHGEIYKDDGWTYYGYPYGLTGDPVAARRNITVHYTAGYVLPRDATPDNPSTLPSDLEGLLIEIVQTGYGKLSTGANTGLKSFGISDVRWEFLNETPQAWNGIIQAHKRYWL